jgi:hypothetical protein
MNIIILNHTINDLSLSNLVNDLCSTTCQFTGEVNMLSGREALVRMRTTKPGKVIELDRQHMMVLIQTDADLLIIYSG